MTDTTDQKSDVQPLEERNAVLSSQLETSPDAILLIDEQRRILSYNHRFIELWGIPTSLLKGGHDEAVQEHLASLQSDPLAYRTWVRRVYAEEAEVHGDEILLADGRIIECHTAPLLKKAGTHHKQSLGRAWYFRDITQRKRTLQALEMSASVQHAIGDAVIIVNLENTILAVNPAFTQITGYSAEQAIGKDLMMLAGSQQDPLSYARINKTIVETGQWRGEVWSRHMSGEQHLKWMETYAVADEQGDVMHRVTLFSDIADQKLSEERLLRETNYDPLTELPNRRLFLDRLKQEVKKVNRDGLMLALLFIDLDHFKDVNDTLGHKLGDQLLIEAARRVTDSVRESDTAARLGGDEFAVILTEMTDPSSIDRIVESILHTLTAPFQIGGEKVYLSASIGITLYPNDATRIDDLLRHADQALYEAKSAGRNCSSYFTSSLQQAAEARMRLSNDLRGALESKQFRVYYQPIIEMATGTVHKAEALIRWEYPELGMVSPANFIPLAEDMRIIIEIGDWVFKEAATEVKRLRTLHHPDFQISVNKSPVQFNNDDILYKGWFDYLAQLDLPGTSISIEITEGLLLASASKVAERLLEFNRAGIQVSLDDFGTGYSSLSYLKKFDIDYLKIDQSFVRDLEIDTNDKALCEAIIAVAHKLGLKVIAEGVETEGQRKFLTDAGCDCAQGYLFSRPVPAADLEAYLAKLRN